MAIEDTANDEQPVETIAEQLSAAFDQIEDEIEDNVESIGDEDESLDSNIHNEVIQDLQPEEPTESLEQMLSAPENWSDADKAMFDQSPDENKEFLLRRYKEMEGDYTRKTTEIADFRKAWEPIQKMYEPYMGEFQRQGLSPQQHLERLAQADLYLQRDPLNGIKWIAKNYGIDINNLFGNAQAHDGVTVSPDEMSPEVAALQNELVSLRHQIEAGQRDAQLSQQNTYLSQIDDFSTEIDEQGNTLHPYFDEVIQDMISLAQAEKASGRDPVLSDLYEKAVWANPEVRNKHLSAEESAKAKKAEKEAIAKAAQAKKASKSVSGAPQGAVSTDNLSLREQLESAIP